MATSYSAVHHLGMNLRCLLQHAVKKEAVVAGGLYCQQVRHMRKKKAGNGRVKDRQETVDSAKTFVSKKAKQIISSQLETPKDVTYLADRPVDNVWVHKHYPVQKLSVEAAINRHKDLAMPDMLDNQQGVMHLQMILDMTTKKKTKMMPNIRNTTILPNPFPYGRPPNILVVCKAEEHLTQAASLGAHTYGTPTEIIKLLNSGIGSPKDFQHVLATADCGNEILPLRQHFKDMFPQRAKGNLSFDLQAMWDLFYDGYTYESIKISEDTGSVQVPLGLIEMSVEELRENFDTYITTICKLRSVALGPFIKSISLVAPPSPESFLLRVEDYVPGYRSLEVDSDDEDEALA